jgi:hypothetical protein
MIHLSRLEFVDSTQPLGPSTVMWPGTPAPAFSVVYSYADDGAFARVALHGFPCQAYEIAESAPSSTKLPSSTETQCPPTYVSSPVPSAVTVRASNRLGRPMSTP